MILLKCKMCGGDLELQDGTSSYTCRFCGTSAVLTGTAGHAHVHTPAQQLDLAGLLRNGHLHLAEKDFADARRCFESVVRAQADSAEGFWGLFLCDMECPKPDELETLLEQRYHDAATPDKLAETHQAVLENANLGKVKRYATGKLAHCADSLIQQVASLYGQCHPALIYRNLEQERKHLEGRAKGGWLGREGTKLPFAFQKLGESYKALGMYEDSVEKAAICLELSKKLYGDFRNHTAEKRQEIERASKRKVFTLVLAPIVFCLLLLGWVSATAAISSANLEKGKEYMASKQYGDAYDAFGKVRNTESRAYYQRRSLALWVRELMAAEDYEKVIELLWSERGDDHFENIYWQAKYNQGVRLVLDGEYKAAHSMLMGVDEKYGPVEELRDFCSRTLRGHNLNTADERLEEILAEKEDD